MLLSADHLGDHRPYAGRIQARDLFDVVTERRRVDDLGARLDLRQAFAQRSRKIFGPASERDSDFGENPTHRPIFYRTNIATTPTTNVDFGYQLAPSLQVHLGANNVFNRYPNHMNGELLQHFNAAGDPRAVIQYPMFSPWVNGGF
ncbi:MAG: hypothetical protein U1F35_11150 [Steroidobacteraceae bacterium]